MLGALHHDRDKVRGALSSLTEPPRHRPIADASGAVSTGQLPSRQRFKRLAAVEAVRASLRAADGEPYYGLDVKKDPLRFKESTIAFIFIIYM